MDDDTYIKTASAGAGEVDYQLNLLLMTLLRAEDKYGDNFRLYSQWENAGNFDDLVLTYKDDQDVLHHHFLQAKHVIDEKKSITYEDLISGDKFNIGKYFNSFKEIQKNINGKIDDLILFSNLALNENVRPFVDPIPFRHPIFHFQQNKKEGNAPVMHKLNSKFIEEYQFSNLRLIAKTFLDYYFMEIEMKATNNVFRDCHLILSTDVVNVTEGKFRDAFIDGEALSIETRQFRDILLEELKATDEAFSSAEIQTAWLRNIQLKFASGFGNSTSKKEPENNWPIALISSDDVELFNSFCKLFILASSQPNIRAEYKNRYSKSQVRLETGFIQIKLRSWFKKVTSNPLSSTFVKDALEYINNNEEELKFIIETARNIQALSPLQLEFESIPYEVQIGIFLQQNESSLFHIQTDGNMKVSLMKLFHCLRKLQFPDFFFSPDSEFLRMIDYLEVFENSETFNILIIELQGTNKSKEVMEELQKSIQKNKTRSKKLIVLSKKGEGDIHPSHPTMTVKDETCFEHLTLTSRQQLLDRKITFQETEIVFNSILSNGIPLNHRDIQSWGCLMDEMISINSKRDVYDFGYYINRTLYCECPYFDINTIQQRLGDQHIVTYNLTDFNREVQLQPTKHVHRLQELDGLWYWRSSNSGYEELQEEKEEQLNINDNDINFLEYVKETLIISDPAGYGKTTLISYLATEIMKKPPLYWVKLLPASKCSFTAEEIQLTAASDKSKYDLFLMEKLFEVSTPLERLVFEQYLKEEECQSKLIFIFDGFDEMNAENRTVIIRACQYLKKKRNVNFIGISTRPQHQQQLEEELQSRSWKLQPFNEDNKITFLEKFWSSRVAIEHGEKIREYAERLIASISRSISENESEWTGIPIQMRTIGELYEEKSKGFVVEDFEENLAFPPIDLFGLYEQIIKKKEDVYVNDKLGFNQSAVQRSVTIKAFQKNQIECALYSLLGSELQLSDEDLADCIGLGIIQKSQNNQFNFIHRTFAEFLTAEYLLDANVSVADKLKNGQLIRVLGESKFYVVRKFMNSKIDIEQMMAEFTKPENDTKMQKIRRQKLLNAIKTLLNEKCQKIFNFLIQLLLFRIKRKAGLRKSYVKRHNRVVAKAPVLSWMLIQTDNDVFLETLKFLISLVLIKPHKEELTTCLIEYQKRLEEEKILSNDEHLKSILWGLNLNSYYGVLFSFEYFRYLKQNKTDIFYAFLEEKVTIHDVMWSLSRDNYRLELYQLMEADSDANFIFDHFVNGVGEKVQFYDAAQFEAYFEFLSRYSRLFDRQRLERFQIFMEWLSNVSRFKLPKSEIVLKFVIRHRDLFSIDEIIPFSVIHKNLSFIENCALWGWTDILKLFLDASDCAVQLERRRILASIRERHSDEQLIVEIANTKISYWGEQVIHATCQFLPNAIRTRDELNLEIFTSWITSEELFFSFMKKSSLTDEVIEFVDKKYPQYMMKCFLVNEESFRPTAAGSQVILEILGNNQKINDEEFWEILKLKDCDGDTILFYVCWLNEDFLSQWLDLLKKKCSNSDSIEQLNTILKQAQIKREKLNINIQKKLSELSREMNFKAYHSDDDEFFSCSK